MSKFKPQLAPNELLSIEDADQLNPNDYFVQVKIDGIRGVAMEGTIKSRSLKEHGNKAIPRVFKELIDTAKSLNLYIDGEFYSRSVSFNELSGIIRSFDKPLPDDLEFIVFDVYPPANPNIPAEKRHDLVALLVEDMQSNNVTFIGNEQWPKSFGGLFQDVLEDGYEGLMVKRKDAPYKLGRGTYKQGIIYKMKPYETFDCVVTGFEQATVVREGAEKKTNELGRSVTSRKKADRVLIDSVAAIWVDFNGLALKVSVTSLTHPERAELWEKRNDYLGKYVEFKGMMVGAKDLPRHPMFVRWRLDK